MMRFSLQFRFVWLERAFMLVVISRRELLVCESVRVGVCSFAIS